MVDGVRIVFDDGNDDDDDMFHKFDPGLYNECFVLMRNQG